MSSKRQFDMGLWAQNEKGLKLLVYDRGGDDCGSGRNRNGSMVMNRLEELRSANLSPRLIDS